MEPKNKLNNLAKHKCPFGKDYFCQLILLFNLFFILFMGHIALFGTIHGFYYTTSRESARCA